MPHVAYETARRCFLKAIANDGTRSGLTTVTWDVSGRCSAPVDLSIEGRPLKRGRVSYETGPGHKAPIFVDFKVPCRKCDACLRQRQHLWAYRAKIETALAKRTWFGTLTLKPDEHAHVLHVARQRAAAKGLDFDALSYKQQFMLRHNVITRYITLYLKRIRKESSAKIRFLFVAEQHKNFLPHYHCLIHEYSGEIKHATLRNQWPHGFVQFKLVEETNDKAVWYVCKYLSKSGAARVRASVRYGRSPLEAAPDLGHRLQNVAVLRLIHNHI